MLRGSRAFQPSALYRALTPPPLAAVAETGTDFQSGFVEARPARSPTRLCAPSHSAHR